MRPLSARNPRVQRLTRLVRRPEDRAEQRAFVVEGPTLVAAALDAGAEVRELYVDGGAADRPAIEAIVARVDADAAWVLPAGTLDRIGDAATSQGVLAVVGHSPVPWPDPATAPFVLVLAGLQDPGNVGTLIRAASASGASAVVCAGGVDPTSPKVVRASAGTVFTLPVARAPHPAVAAARLASDGYRVVGAVAHEGIPAEQADWSEPLALVVGSEAHGLDPDVVGQATQLVTITMTGPAESLNVAMAGTLLCFEAQRHRQGSGGRPR